MRRMFVGTRIALFLVVPIVILQAQSDSAERAVRTIFAVRCVSCHGQARMSGLDLRDLSTILKGGKRGPAAVPGKAEASLIYQAVRREGEPQMPPGNTPPGGQ